MTDEAKKIDKKVIESVLNQVKEYCDKTINCEECRLSEFSCCMLCDKQPFRWDTEKIAEVIVDD